MAMIDADENVGLALKAYRMDAAMRQDELAEAMRALGFSTSQATVGKIERGERKVSFGEAMAFASVLGVEPTALASEPAQVRQDVILNRLTAERAALMEAILRFESAQYHAASETDYYGETVKAEVRAAVLEPIEEVVAEYRDAMTARNTAERDEAIERGYLLRGSDTGLSGERERKFGMTAFYLPDDEEMPHPNSVDWIVRARLAQRGDMHG